MITDLIVRFFERLLFLALWLRIKKQTITINLEDYLITYSKVKTNFIGYNVHVPLINVKTKLTGRTKCFIYPFKINKSGEYKVKFFNYGDFTN